MSAASRQRSEEFLKISDQFRLGTLVTESSHRLTARLSEVAKADIAIALDLLFQADGDVVQKFREFAESGRVGEIAATVLKVLKGGGRIFFSGCGSTGRLSILLDSIWRDFWQKRENDDLENRTFSVMAGGDYALIKSVEGFEDFAAFGKKQLADLAISQKDVLFAITEGGETSFVIGTAWAGVEAGAKVYFVYNNPDEILCRHVQRSRDVILDPRIEKVNLTTGPMSITGSTRMQATSIQLCVMLTVLEMVVREWLAADGGTDLTSPASGLPHQFLAHLETLHANLRSPQLLSQLAGLVALEENTYRTGHKTNYYAGRFAIDVLTDTTERSPTYCTPSFRKFDDDQSAESWAFLFLPAESTEAAWRNVLKRSPRCVEWNETEIAGLVADHQVSRVSQTIRKISRSELMRFRIGQDGLDCRPIRSGDCTVAVLAAGESDTFARSQFVSASATRAKTGVICFGELDPSKCTGWDSETVVASVPVPATGLLLDGVTRVAVKLVMNALSTCAMVRLGRVMGNIMVWVVPGNLKLIDRATRYISELTGLDYEAANALLFEIIEYVEPRMKTDQTYPPVVAMAVIRARQKLTNEEAERFLQAK